MEDLVKVTDKIYLIYGYRIDNYSDVGNINSYKMGSVYNKSEKTTFKFLFNKSFRAPSFIELYSRNNPGFNGSENLKAESTKMLEFIWIQKLLKKDKLKFVLYKGINKNFIGRDFDTNGNRVYKNLGDVDIKGLEISYKKEFVKSKIFLSYSFNDNKYKYSQIVKGNDITDCQGIHKHQFKGYFEYEARKNFSIFSSLFYGSKIHLPNFVGDVNHYFSLNINTIYSPKQNFSINMGIDNITNHKNYTMVFPSDLINKKYFFEYKGAKIPYFDRKVYFSVIKRWL